MSSNRKDARWFVATHWADGPWEDLSYEQQRDLLSEAEVYLSKNPELIDPWAEQWRAGVDESEVTPEHGPGWSLSNYEKRETVRRLHVFLEFFTQQPVHRYATADILRDIAQMVEEREL